jgi:hypothetical protein
MFCFKCGKQLPEGAAFCPFCGTRQVMMDSAAPEPEKPAEDTDVVYPIGKNYSIKLPSALVEYCKVRAPLERAGAQSRILSEDYMEDNIHDMDSALRRGFSQASHYIDNAAELALSILQDHGIDYVSSGQIRDAVDKEMAVSSESIQKLADVHAAIQAAAHEFNLDDEYKDYWQGFGLWHLWCC